MANLTQRLERFFAFDLTTMHCPICAEALEAVRTDLTAKTPGDRVLKAKLDHALALAKCDGEHEPTPEAVTRAVRSVSVDREVSVRCVHKDLVPVKDGKNFVLDENGDKKMTYVRCDVIINGTAKTLAECKSRCKKHLKK